MNRFVQQLEDRRLLSATLTGGVLAIEGTKSNDNVTVALSADGATLTVTEAKARRGGRSSGTPVTTTFAAADVTSITVNGGKGNDNVVFRALGDADFDTPATILGGDGNDWIAAAAGADSIDAGAGDDVVRAGDGNDTVTAGEGDDNVTAGAGDDSVDGNDGDDRLDGGAGADTLNGGDDDDTIYARDGTTTDVIDGGADSAGTDEDDQDRVFLDTGDTATNATTATAPERGNGRHGGHGRGGFGGFGGFSGRRIR